MQLSPVCGMVRWKSWCGAFQQHVGLQTASTSRSISSEILSNTSAIQVQTLSEIGLGSRFGFVAHRCWPGFHRPPLAVSPWISMQSLLPQFRLKFTAQFDFKLEALSWCLDTESSLKAAARCKRRSGASYPSKLLPAWPRGSSFPATDAGSGPDSALVFHPTCYFIPYSGFRCGSGFWNLGLSSLVVLPKSVIHS
jgi:hypothetical protein